MTNQTRLYVYSLTTGAVVDIIDGADNTECERIADERGWSHSDYGWTYTTGILDSNRVGVGTKIVEA